MSILKFLGLETEASAAARAAAETDSVREIAAELEDLQPEMAQYVAKFAYILSRVASADLHVSSEETQEMERIIMRIGGLAEDQARLVVRVAKTRNLKFGAADNFLVTREFGRMATPDQKAALLHCLFAVSAAEGLITTVEENEIRQIASELRVEHREYLTVRLNYRKHLSVLQDLPQGIVNPPPKG